jgi:hypothetical protein
MTEDEAKIKVLPKARLLKVEVSRRWYFARFRGANFTRWQVGCVCVTHRSPWLLDSARALHPHLFGLAGRP